MCKKKKKKRARRASNAPKYAVVHALSFARHIHPSSLSSLAVADYIINAFNLLLVTSVRDRTGKKRCNVVVRRDVLVRRV